MRPQNSRLTSTLKVTVLFLLLILGGVVWFQTCRRRASDQTSPNTPQAKTENIKYSDITYAYHGLLLNSEFQEIKLSPAVLERLQDSMIQSLTTVPEAIVASAISKQQQVPRAALDKAWVDSVLTGFQFTDVERVLLKSALMQEGINSAPNGERAEYQWRFDLINERTIYFNPQTTTNLRSEFENYLVTVNLRDLLNGILRRFMPSEEYVRQCEDNDVPIPPDWPIGEWRNRGALPLRYNFVCYGEDTTVWTYEAPDGQGVCYALERKPGGEPTVVGIVCQSKRTGKACFWENIRTSTSCNTTPLPAGCRIGSEELTLDVSNLQGGSILAENCTDCHRGGNAFLIHPRTPLAAIVEIDRYPDPPLRYEPIGQPTWVNPPAYSPIGSGNCATCHEIADPTPSYCAILRRSTELTMPDNPEGDIVPVRWDMPHPDFVMHIDFLKRRCGTPPLRCPLL